MTSEDPQGIAGKVAAIAKAAEDAEAIEDDHAPLPPGTVVTRGIRGNPEERRPDSPSAAHNLP